MKYIDECIILSLLCTHRLQCHAKLIHAVLKIFFFTCRLTKVLSMARDLKQEVTFVLVRYKCAAVACMMMSCKTHSFNFLLIEGVTKI